MTMRVDNAFCECYRRGYTEAAQVLGICVEDVLKKYIEIEEDDTNSKWLSSIANFDFEEEGEEEVSEQEIAESDAKWFVDYLAAQFIKKNGFEIVESVFATGIDRISIGGWSMNATDLEHMKKWKFRIFTSGIYNF